MKNLTDEEIIISIKKGNASDFGLIIDRYQNKAFSLLKRMLKNEMDAEEVLQDSFLKTYNGLAGFKFESKFSTWFYRIAYNTAMTRLQSKKRKIEQEMTSVDDLHHLKSKYNEEEYLSNETKLLVKKIVDDLPERNSAVITMFYLEEMSCEEISEVLQISVSNVKVLLYRSRNILREVIEKKNLVEELL